MYIIGSTRQQFLKYNKLRESAFNKQIPTVTINNTINRTPTDLEILKNRLKGTAYFQQIFVRPGNVWNINHEYINYDDNDNVQLHQRLQQEVFASWMEATGPLIAQDDNEIYGYYTERIQLLPYNWGQKIPLQISPLDLKLQLANYTSKRTARDFKPEPQFLKAIHHINIKRPEQVVAQLGQFIKHEITLIKVHEEKYHNLFNT